MNTSPFHHENRRMAPWATVRRLLRDHTQELTSAAAVTTIVHGTAATLIICWPLLR